MAITTDVYDGLSVDGSIKVFPVASTILSDSHVRVHFTYPDEVGGPMVDHEVLANTWDVIDNSIVFREAPDESYTVKITVSTTGEGLEVSPSVASTVNENIENIITAVEMKPEIDIVAEASYKAKVINVADNKVNVDTVAGDTTAINQTASDTSAINEIYNNRLEIYEADNNAAIAITKASEAAVSASEAATSAGEAVISANDALASKYLTDDNVLITNNDVLTTNSNKSITAADVVTTNTNRDTTTSDRGVVLSDKYITEAYKKTVESLNNEAVDVLTKVYTSNGDGTFTSEDTTGYSCYHWQVKALEAVTDTASALDDELGLTYEGLQ